MIDVSLTTLPTKLNVDVDVDILDHTGIGYYRNGLLRFPLFVFFSSFDHFLLSSIIFHVSHINRVIKNYVYMCVYRSEHVTMFTLYLPLAVFSFSIKLSRFALASKVRIILRYYFHLCTIFSRKQKCEPHVC